MEDAGWRTELTRDHSRGWSLEEYKRCSDVLFKYIQKRVMSGRKVSFGDGYSMMRKPLSSLIVFSLVH